MLLSLQFPIADLRGVISSEVGRLEKPTWSKLSPGQFVRSIGVVRKPHKHKDPLQRDDCLNARHAFRYAHPGGCRIEWDNSKDYLNIERIYRRLYGDGNVVCTLEVAMGGRIGYY